MCTLKQGSTHYTPTRRQQVLFGLGFIVTIIVANAWLLFFYQLPGRNFFWSSLHNAGHSLVFLGLSLSLCLILHYFLFAKRAKPAILVTVIVSLVFGAAVEIVQSKVGRDASWSDFELDVLGTVAGVAFYLAIYQRGWRRLITVAVFIAVLVVSLREPVTWRIAEIYRSRAFPVLLDFDNPWLNRYVKSKSHAQLLLTSAPAGWLGNPTQVGRVDFNPGSWPGISIEEVHRDWHSWREMSFEVFNPGSKPVTLVVRIHDDVHNNMHKDRFNRTYTVQPGLHHYHIPLIDVREAPEGRQMDMRRIVTVMFYSYKVSNEITLYFDHVALQ